MIWQSGGESEAELYAEDLKEHQKIVRFRLTKGWNFQEGDEITVRVFTESRDKYVQFIKSRPFREDDSHMLKNQKQKEEKKSFKTKINREVGNYYACVSLGDKDECVKIVNI